jgi:hypothetical protein
MRELDGRHLHTRIRGRQALERRLRGVLIAVCRFSRGRATSARDVLWAARAVDAITDLLPDHCSDVVTDHERRV